jgi:hypothetical protein
MIVSHLKIAHDVWLKLYNTYEDSSEIKSSHRDTYNRQYQTFSQKLRESLDDYFARFESIVSSLRSCGPLAYFDNKRAKQLLYALDDHVWGMKITALEESANFATLDTEKLFSKLKSHELFQIMMLLLLVKLLLLVLVLVAMTLTPPTPLYHLLWSLLCLTWLQLLMSSTRASQITRSPCWQENSAPYTSSARRGGDLLGAASSGATPPTSSPTAPSRRSSTPPLISTTTTTRTTHIAHLEAIRILLAFTASKRFKLYQMDVKSAFLNCVIQEEVFVRQPSGFKNSKYPNRVYNLLKTLYGLKQAPWAWYATLKIFLLEHEYVMGSVDKALFTLNHGIDSLLVHIYMDDIIFGGTSHTLVSRF